MNAKQKRKHRDLVARIGPVKPMTTKPDEPKPKPLTLPFVLGSPPK